MTHRGSGAGEEIALPGFSSCPREDVALTSSATRCAPCRLVQQQSRNSVKDGRQPELNVPPQDAQQPTHGSAMLLAQGDRVLAGGARRNSLLASGGAEDSDVLQGDERQQPSDLLGLGVAAPENSNNVIPAGLPRRNTILVSGDGENSDVLTSNASRIARSEESSDVLTSSSERRIASTTLEAIMLSQPLNPLVPVRPQKIERRR